MLRSALLASAVLFVSVPSTAWADEQAGGQGSSAAPLAGATFRHCRDCPDMVVIPAGKVAIGSAQAETDRENMPADQAAREHPQKTVTIARPFALATFGITNGFGLYGMLGNVGEWTADCGLHSYAKPSPTDGSADVTGDCTEHVGRGGSWWNDAYYIRAARRFSSVGRYYILGFRVAMDI